MANERKAGEIVGKPVEISLSEVMDRATKRRDELNVFIRLLMNVVQGRDFVDEEIYK